MTAKELFKDYSERYIDSDGEFSGYFVNEEDFKQALIKFAKYHVEKALKAVSEKVELNNFAYEFLQEGSNNAINTNSILNAYNLDDIK